MSEKQIVKNGGVTPEMIQTWKAKHGRVVEITVTEENVQYVGYFHRPDMETMSATNVLTKKDEVKGSEVMFKNCWLGGDPQMEKDAIIKMAAIGQLAGLFNFCTAELKNL